MHRLNQKGLRSVNVCSHPAAVFKRIIKAIPGAKWLREGYPDEARFVVQSAALRRVLNGRTFKGAILNPGSGEGLYADFLDQFPEARRIVHLDLEKPSVCQADFKRHHENVAGSVTALPFSDGEFDACLCTEVIEHVADDEKAFAELSRVLKPGGLLLISTPTPPAPFDPAHAREGYGCEELRDRLAQHGFEVLQQTFCFHWVMRKFVGFWRWQFETFGGGKRSWIPRFLVRCSGILDRFFPIGRPWDLVILARRRSSGAIR